MAERPGGVLALGSKRYWTAGQLEQVLKSVPEQVPDDREDYYRAQDEGYEGERQSCDDDAEGRSRGRRMFSIRGRHDQHRQPNCRRSKDIDLQVRRSVGVAAGHKVKPSPEREANEHADDVTADDPLWGRSD